jgi:hypothetical protein
LQFCISGKLFPIYFLPAFTGKISFQPLLASFSTGFQFKELPGLNAVGTLNQFI